MTIILILIGMATAFYLGYRSGYSNGHFKGVDHALSQVHPRPK